MITTDRISLYKPRQCVDRQTMRLDGQLRSSVAGKARQTGDRTASWKDSDSFNQVTLCPPSTNEEAKGALKWMTSPPKQGLATG